jgi:transaldolase
VFLRRDFEDMLDLMDTENIEVFFTTNGVVGRLERIARLEEQTGKPGAGPELVRAIRGSFGALGIKGTRILAASFRTPAQVTAALAAGADLATVPPKVLRQMSSHAGTRGAMRSFRDAWRGAERVRPQVRQRGGRR